METKLLNILNSLCNSLIADGTVTEEVIDMIVSAGADIRTLKAIGFTDSEISDYVYYVSMIENISEDDVWAELK